MKTLAQVGAMRTKLALLVAAVLPVAVGADEVFLKGGGQLSGKITSRTPTSVEVDVGAGKIAVPASSVLRIEEGRSPLHEFEDRASRIAAGDVDGWIALGDWAKSRGLGSQAREAYNRALAASPGDPRANAALGNVQVDGRWMSEEQSYKAKGLVQFEGEWITPAEQQALELARAAEDARDRERKQADARVREAEARAAEAEARADEAEAEAQQSSDGIPLWYAWGGGPVYWPSGPIVTPPVSPSRPVSRPRPVPR
jgi:hypothetical protein